MNKSLYLTLGAIFGALLLFGLSFMQELLADVPLRPIGFVVPVLFGLLAGTLSGWLLYRVKAQFTELRRQHDLLNTIFSATPDVLVLKDKHSIYLHANEAFSRFIGKPLAEITGKSDFDLFPEEEAKIYRRDDAAVMESAKPLFQDEEVSAPDGKHWMQVAKVPVIGGDGEVSGLLISVRDITARKRAEDALSEAQSVLEQRVMERTRDLQEKERELAVIIDSLPHMLFVKDAEELRFVRFNKAGEKLLGIGREEMLGRNDYDFFPKEQADFFTAKDREALASKVLTDIPEEPIETPRGKRYLHTRKVCVSDEQGRPKYLLGISEDITEHKQLENEARRNWERFRDVSECSSDWIWEIDAQGCYSYVGAGVEDILGYRPEEVLGKTPFDLMPQEQAASAREFFNDVLRQKQAFRAFVNVNLHKDGRRVTMETSGVPVLDENGGLLGYRGADTDISARARQEQVLQRFRRLLNLAMDGIAVIDPSSGRYLDVNEALCAYLGLDRETLLQRHVYEFSEIIDSADKWRQSAEELRLAGKIVSEDRGRRADGRPYVIEVKASYSTEDEGEYIVAIFRDIQARKLEEQIVQLRQQLSEMVYTGSEKRLIQTALDAGERMTRSAIGFFHYVEKDQETVSLQTWSTRTLKEMCFAEGDGLHYPVSQAGVWVDCIHQRNAVIHNDYKTLPHKKGLPEGHAPVLRELVVPVFRDNRIVAVMGVGNKAEDYDRQDLDLIERIADMAFDFIERKQAERQIKFMAYNDVLTGLPNRQLLADRLRQAARTNRRSDSLMAVCYMDLDGFKAVNDRFGHEAGDRLLAELAARLQAELREDDTLARLGGDEFAIILSGLGTIYHGEEIVQRVLEQVAQPFEIEANRMHISASVGMTFYPHDDVDPDTLLRHADQAMYKAKNSGKNTYRLFDPIEDQKVHARRQALEDFERAINNSELVLYYQPRIHLDGGKLAGVEALVRWQHPQQGLLPPGRFLPSIEETPLEIALDEWVMKTALDQHMLWREQGMMLPVSVNLSPRHIQQRNFPDYLSRLLSAYPDDIAGQLELEVLETGAIGDTTLVSEVMNACAELGVQFSLDDFGTGYSSLTYFHRLPISILKVDQNFVRAMLTEPQDQDIVEGVLRLADALNRPVVAEGVENIELGFMLLQLGCQYAQGYGIAKPMPAEEVPGWSEQWLSDGQWRLLPRYAEELAGNYDLNVAIYTHQRWMAAIEAHLRSGLDGECPELDGGKCCFAEWYAGIGAARYGAKPQYAFVHARHLAVHDIAAKLLDQAREETPEAALRNWEDLQHMGDELVGLMRKLA